MIFFDVETTGLINNEGLPLSQQPEIIEIGAMRVDREQSLAQRQVVVLEEFTTFVKPRCAQLPEIITKITGLTDADLKDAPAFVEVFGALADVFIREAAASGLNSEMLAHNARFDLMLLVFELRRCGKEFNFPFAIRCTDTRTIWPGKLANWGKKVKGEGYVQPHRALEDVKLLAECYFADSWLAR